MAGSDKASIPLSYTQTLRCDVQASLAPASKAGQSLTTRESCNDGAGYALILEHPPQSVDAIIINGRSVEPAADGRTLVKSASRAQKSSSHITIRAREDITLALRIEPSSLQNIWR